MAGEREQYKTCWDCEHQNYTCADGTNVCCGFEKTVGYETAMSRNGLLARRGRPPAPAVCEVQMSRSDAVVYRGSRAKTYTFPRTAVAASENVFKDLKRLQSVRLN